MDKDSQSSDENKDQHKGHGDSKGPHHIYNSTPSSFITSSIAPSQTEGNTASSRTSSNSDSTADTTSGQNYPVTANTTIPTHAPEPSNSYTSSQVSPTILPPMPMVASASTQPDIAKPATHTGMIAGAVIGSLVCIFMLLLGVLLFLRRRRQLPPSAEFMLPNNEPFHAQHGKFILSRWMRHNTDSQRLMVESDNPPPFTVGSWKDPVLEKAASAERQQTEVLARLDSRNAGRTYVDFEGQSYAV